MTKKLSLLAKTYFAAGALAIGALVGGIWKVKQDENFFNQTRPSIGVQSYPNIEDLVSEIPEAERAILQAQEQDSRERRNLENSATNPNVPYAENYDSIPGMNKTNQPIKPNYQNTPAPTNKKIRELITPAPKAETLNPAKRKRNTEVEYSPVANFIMSDEFFLNSNYLSEQDVKDMFRKYNSCLQNKGLEKLIVRECKEHQVNPIWVLTILQAEQGLVQQTTAPTKYQLDYAMGVGDLEHGKKKPSYGIEYQIREGIAALDKNYDKFKEGEKMRVDFCKNIVIPKNATERALYGYTPHTPGVNLKSKIIKRYASI